MASKQNIKLPTNTTIKKCGNEDYEFINKIDGKKKYLVIGFVKQIWNKIIPKIILSKCILFYAYYNPSTNIILAAGANFSGQLGTGDTNHLLSFKKLQWSVGLSINKITYSLAGAGSFITTSGNIYVTGKNTHGQLGLNSRNHQLSATQHPFFKDKLKILNISLGMLSGFFTFFICRNGSIYGTGGNQYGQLGLGSDIQEYSAPQKLVFFSNNNISIISAACSRENSFFLTSNGEVYSCGSNYRFQLGYQTTVKNQITPQKITNIQDTIISIKCGYVHSYCLSKNGIIYSFGGNNEKGQLGVDKSVSDNNKNSIHTISWFIKHNKFIKQISSGKYHAAAIDMKGNIFVWGSGVNGEIGNGTRTNSFTPIQVDALNNMKIIDISCGAYHIVALTKKNVLYCWGENKYHECSKDNAKEILLPNDYYQNDYIRSVSAGYYCTLILLNPP